MPPRFLTDAQMAELEASYAQPTPIPTSIPKFLTDEQMAQLEAQQQASAPSALTNWGQSFAKGAASLGDIGQQFAKAVMPGGRVLEALGLFDKSASQRAQETFGSPDYSQAGFPERAVGAVAEALPFSFMGGPLVTALSAVSGEVTDTFGLGRLPGELVGGGIPGLLKTGKRFAIKPSADEIKASAALAQKELTGISRDVLESAIQKVPQDDFGKLMSTAEITDNAGFAQIEKDLGSKVGPFSNAYNARALDREIARNKILDALIPERAPRMETEALGTEVIKEGLKQKLSVDKAEKAAWNLIPRKVDIPTEAENKILSRLLNRKQAGLPLDRQVKLLAEQFGREETTSGALQDIRSGALELLRTKDLDGYSRSVATSLVDLTDRALKKGFNKGDYTLYKEARDVTRNKAELFGQTSAGGSIINPNTQAQNVLSNALKGDRRSVAEFRKAIGNNQELIDATKRWVVENVPRDAKGQLTVSGFNRFLNNRAGQLKEMFGEDHYKRLNRIVEDIRSQDIVLQKAYRSSGHNSPTAPRQTVAGGIKELVLDSIPGGRVVGRMSNAVGKSSGRANEAITEQINEWLFKASLDPKIALELSKTSTSNRVKGVWELLKESGRDSLIQGIRGYLQSNATEPKQSEQSKPAPIMQDLLKSPNLSSESIESTNQERILKNQLLQPSTYSPNNLKSVLTSTQGSTVPKVSQPSGRQQFPENAQRATSLNPASYADPNQVKKLMEQQHPLIRAVAQVESGGNPRALSPAGAQGLMQLMPGTAREVGVKNTFNPEESIQGGTQYLIQNLEKFKDVNFALAGYNAGPARVDKAIKATIKAGERVTWANVQKRLPQETRNYVRKVKNIYTRYI